MNELTIDGKIYISSKKAAEITGYAKDYIGQLCREGHVDARMVGRSWYVLETSIRAHRFGGDPHAAPIEAAPVVSAPDSVIDTWEKPTYIPEMAPSMPIPSVQRAAEPDADTDLSSAESLTDMQEAWKEWFAQKQDTLIESPEIIDAREDVHDREDEIEQNIQAFKDAHQDIEESHHEVAIEAPEPVTIQAVHTEPEQRHFEEIEEQSEPVVIHHAPEPVYSASVVAEEAPVLSRKERKQAQLRARKVRRSRQVGNGGSFVLQALLTVLILFVVVVTVIGTGYATRFISVNPMLAPVFNYLGGTSTFSK
jgi:hypothetical protein